MTPFARIPSTCVNIHVMNASASVTDSVEVAAKIASVGSFDAGDVDLLVRERQRDEAEHVDDPDEDHQARAVREPRAHRLLRQALLGDLDAGRSRR